MSYDFRLFKRRAGEDPRVTAQHHFEGLPTTPPDPRKEALKRRVADALIARNPKLEVFQFGYEEIAKVERISVDEARLIHRHLELNGPEEGSNGVQITLFDNEASVTVPFWHKGEKAADAFREIWSYLEIISRETGYFIYDPQIDRIIDPSAGFDDVLGCYIGAVGRIHKALPPGKAVSGQKVLQGIQRLAGDVQRSTKSIHGAITSALGLARRIKSQRRLPSRRESMGRDAKTQGKRTRDSR